jgi:hypothetical protein
MSTFLGNEYFSLGAAACNAARAGGNSHHDTIREWRNLERDASG